MAKDYTRRFGYAPYYDTFIGLLEKYCSDATTVFEVGGANGIIPERWDAVRRASYGSTPLSYYGIEPIAEAVAIAQQKAKDMELTYRPHIGTLEDALTTCNLQRVDVVVMSRVLHELFLGYYHNAGRLAREIGKLLGEAQPLVFVHGDAEQVQGLTPEETQRFIDAQTSIIGHGHDPARDYLPFQWVIGTMAENGYQLQEEQHLVQPLKGFARSPWRFGIGVFAR